MRKKGQAAMEFLMTYGWAILAAVIVIGVLATFGVFSPSTYVPNSCTLTAPLGCIAGIAETTGVQLEVINGAGDTVTVTAVDVVGCVGAVSPALPLALADSTAQVYTVPCTLTDGEKFQGEVTITYTKSGSTLPQNSVGKLVDKV